MLRPLILLAVLVAAALALPSAAPLRPSIATAQSPTTPPLEITLFGNTVRWEAFPESVVRAELRGPDGRRAAGTDWAGVEGEVELSLYDYSTGFPEDAYIRPGDHLRIARYGLPPIEARVPELRVAVDVEADRLTGIAPAGAALDARLHRGASETPIWTRTVTAGPDGAFQADLRGEVDLVPGDHGLAHYVSPEGHRFTALFAATTVEVTAGANRLRGRAAPGTRIAAEVLDAAGRRKGRVDTLVAGGIDWTLPRRWGYWDVGAIVPGDTVRLSRALATGGVSETLDIAVPALALTLDRGRGVVSGTGPAGAALSLEVWPPDVLPPDGTPLRQDVTTDAGGRFRADLAGRAALDPGTRVGVAHAVAPGVRARALAAVRQVAVTLHGSLVGGVAEPGQPVTATLRGPDGSEKAASWGARGDDQGLFEADVWGPGDGVAISAGDLVEVEFAGGDPLTLTVPALTARTDAAADVVSGEAPPGATVRVRAGMSGAAPGMSVTADSQGRYRAELAGAADLVSPGFGPVAVETAAGHRFVTHWSAVRMALSGIEGFDAFNGYQLAGNGPPDREVRATVRGPDGRVVAGADDRTYRFFDDAARAPEWFLYFHDETGASTAAEPGDVVEAVVGDDAPRFTVPELDGVVFVADDRVTGRTRPGAEVTLRARRLADGATAAVPLTAGTDGVFDHAFGAALDLQYNDVVMVAAEVDGHGVSRTLSVPGLKLDLDDGTLAGSWTPDTSVTVELRDVAGNVRAAAAVFTHGDATFSVQLTEADGSPMIPRPGERFTVRAGGAPAREPLTLVVPELAIDWDTAAGVVIGRATPGGTLIFYTSTVYNRFLGGGEDAVGRAAIAADGTYRVDFVPAIALRPGLRLAAEYRLPEGHLVTRSAVTPILNVQHGGAEACGYAAPGAAVDVRVIGAGGGVAAQASARSERDGRFRVAFRDAAGRPFATQAGHTVSARLGTADASITLPPVETDIDWTVPEGRGIGPADTDYYVEMPSTGCEGGSSFARSISAGRTDPDGTFWLWMLDEFVPEDGMDLAFYSSDGHRFYRSIFRTFAEVYLRTPRVAGRAPAMAPVGATLLDGAGRERARAASVVGSDGRFEARLADGAGAPVAIQPGDRVRLEAGGETVTIVAEPLDFDFDGVREILVDGPRGRDVRLELTVYEGGEGAPAPFAFERTLGADGTLKFTAADVPPRATWSLADVTRVRVVLPNAEGHRIIAETVRPNSPGKRLYLPALVNRAGWGAQAARDHAAG